MYDQKQIQFVGAFDYDREAAERMAKTPSFETFSVGIFQWELANNGKRMKRGKVAYRVTGHTSDRERVIARAELLVIELDAETYTGPKTITVKPLQP